MSFNLLSLFAVSFGAPYAEVRTAPSADERSCLKVAPEADAKVILLSEYGGRGASAPFNLAGGTHKTHTVAVTGSGREKVILIVAAYEPTIWDLTAVRSRVTAVIASGHYPQGVSGLPKSTPVRFLSQTGREFDKTGSCAWLPWAYKGLGTVEQMAAAATIAVGRHPDRYYGGYNPTGFDIDGGSGSAPRAPRLSDVRAAVPIIKDDTSGISSFQNDYGPPDDGRIKVADRVVKWDAAGKIISVEGFETGVPRYELERPEAIRPRPIRATLQPDSSPWAWVLALGVIAILIGRRRAEDVPIGYSSDAPLDTPPLSAPTREAREPKKRFPDDQLSELSTLSAMTGSEPLVVTLHRLGRELILLSRHAFDPDLADEINAIVEKHLSHAIDRYRQVRPALGDAEAVQADESLRRALGRLTSRLHELWEEQQHRDVSGIDEAARFIDARHPRNSADFG